MYPAYGTVGRFFNIPLTTFLNGVSKKLNINKQYFIPPSPHIEPTTVALQSHPCGPAPQWP